MIKPMSPTVPVPRKREPGKDVFSLPYRVIIAPLVTSGPPPPERTSLEVSAPSEVSVVIYGAVEVRERVEVGFEVPMPMFPTESMYIPVFVPVVICIVPVFPVPTPWVLRVRVVPEKEREPWV